MTGITMEIIKKIAVLNDSDAGYTKELNLVSWNDGSPKQDLRDWDPDHEKMGKGITLSADEVKALYDILKDIMES